jgi:hypothetical protein
MKKIKITEGQLERLKKNIVEGAVHSNLVKQIKLELDKNYRPVDKFVRQGGEYFEKKMIEVLADGELITPKSLFEYMKYKYKLNDEFIKQVITDWTFGKIDDDYGLSKNISLG